MRQKIIDPAIAIELFPNTKEQSESVGAFLAVSKFITVVGDGTTLRTGYLFATCIKQHQHFTKKPQSTFFV